MQNHELCVPASAVSAAGEEEGQSVAPEVGDTVEVSVGGKVSRVEGGNVYLTPDTANGQPIGKMGGEPEGHEDSESDMDQMMAGAMKSRDSEEGMGY